MNDNQNRNNNKNKKNLNGLLILLGWAVVLTVVFNYLSAYSRQASDAATTHEISYSAFKELVIEGNVKEVLITDDTLEITTVDGYVYTDADGKTYGSDVTLFTMQIGVYDMDLAQFLTDHGVEYGTPYVPEMSPILEFMLTYILPTILMVGLFVLFMNLMARRGGGIGGIGNVGKSNAKVYMEKTTGVTFADVAGQDEAKESLVEIIDFLHNPGKYTAIGAKLPRGALLVGSPGTGKTLLAKAVAGEAGVPFFSISGSGFVEMFVGVGASRVRDLFQEAAKVAPCIIFIDEIDAIGKTRDTRFGGNDEREQTLNQLLAEMDGFDPSKGIIVLAATNRPEVLDKALLRPGRFDRRITVDRPNLAGRLATLQVHTRKIRLAEDVDLNKIAQATAGCVGADLANTVNEAALRAVRHGRHAVNQEDLLASFEMVIAGAEKKGTVITEQEKRIIAYHEVGHALAAAKQKNAQPVTKITIVPHTELHPPPAGGGEVPHEQGGHPHGDPDPAGGALRRGAGVRHPDLRGRQRHRAGHGAGEKPGGPLRHERQVRHDGPGHRAEPVPGRRVQHELRPGDLRRRRPGGGRPAAPLPRRGPGAAGDQPGHAGRRGRLSHPEGDHHRRADDGYSGGTGPGPGGLLRRARPAGQHH